METVTKIMISTNIDSQDIDWDDLNITTNHTTIPHNNNHRTNNNIQHQQVTNNPYTKLTPISKLISSITTGTSLYKQLQPFFHQKPNRTTTTSNHNTATTILSSHDNDETNNPNKNNTEHHEIHDTTQPSTAQNNNFTNTTTSDHNHNDTPTTNNFWGDYFDVKKDDTIRIVFQNIHGLRITNFHNNKWKDCIDTIQHQQIDIIGLAETCANWNKRRICQRLRSQLRKGSSTSTHINFSRTNYQHDTDYLPGGTLQVSMGEWATRIKRQLHDPHNMNRWTGIQYQLNRQRSLYVFTAYKVCKQDIKLGVYSSFKQQLLQLHQRFPDQAEHLLSPRKYFAIDFINYVKSLHITTDDYLLLLIDANEVLGEDRTDGILNIMTSLSLKDLFCQYHQSECNISTYIGSKARRIDYILGTTNIQPFIKQCGYTPFLSTFESDHRTTFIDLSTELSDGQIKLQAPQNRLIGFTTNKTELVKYKKYIVQQFALADIPARAQELHDKAGYTTDNDEEFTSQLNQIDDEITNIMLTAEKTQCKAKHSIPWNTDIQQATLYIKYWNLLILNKSKTYDIKPQLREIYNQLSTEQQISIDTTTSSFKTNLRHAVTMKKQSYFDLKQKRQEKIENLIAADSNYYGITTEQAATRRTATNKTKQLFTYLQTVYVKSKGRKVSMIEVPIEQDDKIPDTNTEQWRSVTDPNEMIELIRERNIKHFGQANKTPFATEPLKSIFGYTGTTAATQQLIFDHQIPMIPSNLPGIEQLMDILSDGNNLEELNDTITIDEFWKGFQTWKEKTSTSPSGRHLGHYKALLTPDGQDHLYDNDFPNPSDLIKRVYYQIATAAVKAGTTLQRWCNSSTLMLEKQQGVARINKLRVIHIFEADYNILLKLLWARKLVWHCHDNNKLHPAQSGSRPDNRCIDVVIKKELNYEYARLTRTTLATIDNDAKSCYDRILCNLAMITSRYYGMPLNACKFHSKTLQQMKFKIRTTAGDSQQTYYHSEQTPIHGTGQGSCASPCLWLLTSNIILRAHEKQAQGMTRHDVVKGNITTTNAAGFVDDVALLINDEKFYETLLPILELLEPILRHIKWDLNLWQDLLYATGGKLELIKCFLYILAWRFNKFGDPVPLTKQEMERIIDTAILITDPETKDTVTLEQKDVHEVHRTLGAWKTISGNHDEQTKVLLEKSNNLAIHTKLGQLTRFQARRAYSSIYIPAMTYSLVATNCTSQELYKIQSKALAAFLPAMGFEPTFPRAVVHAPRRYGGLNIGNLYTDMMIAKIGTILEHTRANTELGKLIILNINWTQLHLGIQKPFLESHQVFSYVPTNWFIHVQEFLTTINAQIILKNIWQVTYERNSDTAIMDHIIANPKLKNYEKRIFNNWRIFFKATTLSDITAPAGNQIHPYYWRYQELYRINKPPRQSKLNWPLQQQPDLSTFSIWRKGLRTSFNLTSKGHLKTHLQHWTTSPSTSNSWWDYYYDITTQALYINQFDGNYWIFEQNKPTTKTNKAQKMISSFDPTPEDTTTILPDTCVPVSPLLHTNTIITIDTTFARGKGLNPAILPPISFDNYIATLPSWRANLIQYWYSIDTTQLAQIFHTATNIIIASDGGYDAESGEGTFGVVIATMNVDLMSTMGYAPAKQSLGSSFRAELYGLLAALVLLYETVTYYRINIQQSTTITTFIDNKSVGQSVNKHQRSPIRLGNYVAADMDIELTVLEEIRKVNRLGFLFRPIRHIKAHQDRHTPYSQLSREAQLNIMADELATITRHESTIPSNNYNLPDTVKSMLYINEQPITSKYQECIKDAYFAQPIFIYYANKFHWDTNIINDIHWDSFESAIKKLSNADRQRIQKYCTNRLHTNVREKYFHSHASDQCPSCQSCIETHDHILQCTEPTRQQIVLEWEHELLEYLSSEGTPRSVQTALLLGIKAWLHNQEISNTLQNIVDLTPQVIEAFHNQSQIGWDQLTKGKISKKWINIIQQHLHSNNVNQQHMTATKWATNFITLVWKGVLNSWDIRNKDCHGTDQTTCNTKEKEKLLAEADYLQRQAKVHGYYDIHWLNKSLQELEGYPVYGLKAWVRNARTISRLYHQERKTNATAMTNRDFNLKISNLGGEGDTVNSNVSTGRMESGGLRSRS